MSRGYYSVIGQKFADEQDARQYANARGFKEIVYHEEDNQAVRIRLSDQTTSEQKTAPQASQEEVTK